MRRPRLMTQAFRPPAHGAPGARLILPQWHGHHPRVDRLPRSSVIRVPDVGRDHENPGMCLPPSSAPTVPSLIFQCDGPKGSAAFLSRHQAAVDPYFQPRHVIGGRARQEKNGARYIFRSTETPRQIRHGLGGHLLLNFWPFRPSTIFRGEGHEP